ncbi:MAG: DUF4238 domain-containing protein [Chitinophagaceae bacterium]|nr:DUF4238 domain-containing protein [Chitinophagaceae bacterium]
MKNQPVLQHDLPATYLRRFAIDPNNKKLRSLIWCFRKVHDKYMIEQKSVTSNLFTTENFYTVDSDEDPFAIENFFAKEVEPRFEMIMKEISKEKDLTRECRTNIILWLHYNKLRNSFNRNHIQKMYDMSSMVSLVPKIGIKGFNELKPELDKHNLQNAKHIQFSSFIDKNLLETFEKGISAKHWLFLKSPNDTPFLSSDNPGFSVHIEEDEINFKTLSPSFSTNAAATNYFILSPQYCLVISPFYKDTPIEINSSNQVMEFKKIGQQHLDIINFCTIRTFSKYLISNKEEMLLKVKAFFIKQANHKTK